MNPVCTVAVAVHVVQDGNHRSEEVHCLRGRNNLISAVDVKIGDQLLPCVLFSLLSASFNEEMKRGHL